MRRIFFIFITTRYYNRASFLCFIFFVIKDRKISCVLLHEKIVYFLSFLQVGDKWVTLKLLLMKDKKNTISIGDTSLITRCTSLSEIRPVGL